MANVQLADNLRRLRKQHNYTQEQLSRKLNITHQAYSNYENGVRDPNIHLLAEIAWIHRVSLDSLVTQSCSTEFSTMDQTKTYFCIKIENSRDDILLTREEVNFLLKYRSATDNDRKLVHEVLSTNK